MASHCPYCDSTDITPQVKNGVHYFHCNACNRNFITPVVDPELAAQVITEADAESIDGGGTAS